MSWCCRSFSLPPRRALLTNARSRAHSLAEGIENRHLVAGCSSGSETDSTNTVTARQPPNIDIIAGARPESHHDRFLSNLQAMAAVDSDLFVRSTCDFRKTTRQLALKFRAKMAFSTAENNPPAVGQHCPSPWTRRDETVSNGATNEARGVRIHQCVEDRE